MQTKNWQIHLIQLLTIPGVMVAYYLLLFHSGTLFTTCSTNEFFDCGQVSGPLSPYSSVGPIPVALIGLIGYFTIFLVIWLRDWFPDFEEYMPMAVLSVVGLAFLATLALTALELFVIHAFCQYCLISAGIVLAMFVLAVSYYRSNT